jgi:hypothetical protein
MLERLNLNVYKITLGFDFFFIVRTSAGNIRIGGMPDSWRFLDHYKIANKYVILIPPELHPIGDNLAGEESVLFRQSLVEKPRTHAYIGRSRDIGLLSDRLSLSDEIQSSRFKSIPGKTVRSLFRSRVLNHSDDRIELGACEIVFSHRNIEIFDNHRLIYDHREHIEGSKNNYRIEKLFEKIPSKIPFHNRLSVLVTGNGKKFNGPSLIVAYGDRRIWVDVCARPFHLLARNRLHPDCITDIIITQGQENICPGLPAILCRARETLRTVNLMTTAPVYAALKRRYGPLFQSGFESVVNFINLNPGVLLPYFKGGILASQSSPPGLKFEFNGSHASFVGSAEKKLTGDRDQDMTDLYSGWKEKSELFFYDGTQEKTEKKMSVLRKGMTVRISDTVGISDRGALEGFCYSIKKGKVRISRKL